MAVRKNQATLTAKEKRDFVNAVLELKRAGRYDSFVSTHNTFIVGDTDNGERTLDQIHERRIHITGSFVRRSSLEDVFLRLTGRTLVD